MTSASSYEMGSGIGDEAGMVEGLRTRLVMAHDIVSAVMATFRDEEVNYLEKEVHISCCQAICAILHDLSPPRVGSEFAGKQERSPRGLKGSRAGWRRPGSA